MTISNEKNGNQIFCMKCGRELQPFYLYCIYCGASTKNNPKNNLTSLKKGEKGRFKELKRGAVAQTKKHTNYLEGGWTRHEAFSQILHDYPPRSEYKEGDIVVLNVLFNLDGHTYCYRAKDNIYKPGDIVEVEVKGGVKAVTVESVGYYSKEEYPFDVVPLNYVKGMATGELKKKYEELIAKESESESEREIIRKDAEKRLKEIRADNSIIRNLKSIRESLSSDEEINKRLGNLEIKMAKVIAKSEEMIDDEDNSDAINERIHKLYSTYLPKTISVLEQYEDIFSGGLPSEEAESLRTDLIEAINKSDQVYNNVLISLYEKDMMELKVEMEALKTMFALSGLLDSDFEIKG